MIATQAPPERPVHNHFACRGNCSGLPLTLADKQYVIGRDVTCYDERAGTFYCGDCLADLPQYPNGNLAYEALSHVCGEAAEVAAEPAPFEHKTRTTAPTMAETGGPMRRRAYPRDRASFAYCTCGWMQACDRRDMARVAARAHREGAVPAYPVCFWCGDVDAGHFPCATAREQMLRRAGSFGAGTPACWVVSEKAYAPELDPMAAFNFYKPEIEASR